MAAMLCLYMVLRELKGCELVQLTNGYHHCHRQRAFIKLLRRTSADYPLGRHIIQRKLKDRKKKEFHKKANVQNKLP